MSRIKELLIVASSSEIILHWVRWQLVFGDGLPLGLIGSGFTFSQLRSVSVLSWSALVY